MSDLISPEITPEVYAFPEIAEDWKKIQQFLNEVLKESVFETWSPAMANKYPTPPNGWSRWDGDQWSSMNPEMLPIAMGLDIECSRFDNGWLASFAMARGNGKWYAWKGNAEVIPFPPKRILVMQDGARHDLTFLSCSYSHPGKTMVLDVRSLAAAMNGIPPECIDLWTAFKGREMAGQPSHPWAANCTKLDLESLSRFYLGRAISKDLQEKHKDSSFAALWEHTEPKTLVSYCSQDVVMTLELGDLLLCKLFKQYMKNPVSLCGMLRLSTAAAIVDGAKLQENITAKVRVIEEELKSQVEITAIALKGDFEKPGFDHPKSDLDWRVLKGGKDKGELRWFRDLEKSQFNVDTVIAIQVLDLYFDNEPLEWNGKKFAANSFEVGRLPLSTTLIESGELTSRNPYVSPELLYSLAELREKLTEYRRYLSLTNDLHLVGPRSLAKLPTRPGDVAHCPSTPLLEYVMDQAVECLVLPEGKRVAMHQLDVDIPEAPGEVGKTRTANAVFPPDGLSNPEGIELREPWAIWWRKAHIADAIHSHVAARAGQRLIGVTSDGKVYYEVEVR